MEAATPSRLLSFDVEPGEARFVARRVRLPEERAGWAASIAALLLTAALAMTSLFRRRRGGALSAVSHP